MKPLLVYRDKSDESFYLEIPVLFSCKLATIFATWSSVPTTTDEPLYITKKSGIDSGYDCEIIAIDPQLYDLEDWVLNTNIQLIKGDIVKIEFYNSDYVDFSIECVLVGN